LSFQNLIWFIKIQCWFYLFLCFVCINCVDPVFDALLSPKLSWKTSKCPPGGDELLYLLQYQGLLFNSMRIKCTRWLDARISFTNFLNFVAVYLWYDKKLLPVFSCTILYLLSFLTVLIYSIHLFISNVYYTVDLIKCTAFPSLLSNVRYKR